MSLKKLKIAYIVPTTGFGGTEIHSISLTKYLKMQGADVTFFFPDILSTLRLSELCFDNDIKFYHADIGNPGNQDISTFLTHQSNSLKISFDKLDIDFDLCILAAPSPIAIFGIIDFLKKKNLPTVCIFHLVNPSMRFSDLEKETLYKITYPSLRFVSVSEYTKDVLNKVLEVPLSSIEVIENGVEIQKNQSCDSYSNIKKQLGLRSSTKLIYSFGRLHSQKAMDVLIDSVSFVVERFPDVHFIVAGEGELKESLLTQLEMNGLSRYVSFIGFVENPYLLVPYVDIVALPTRFESLSVRLLETMEMGGVIVTNDVSYQDKFLCNGVDSFIAKGLTPESLSEKILLAIENESSSILISENAKEKVLNYSHKIMCQKYSECINNLLYCNIEKKDENLQQPLEFFLNTSELFIRVDGVKFSYSDDDFLSITSDDFLLLRFNVYWDGSYVGELDIIGNSNESISTLVKRIIQAILLSIDFDIDFKYRLSEFIVYRLVNGHVDDLLNRIVYDFLFNNRAIYANLFNILKSINNPSSEFTNNNLVSLKAPEVCLEFMDQNGNGASQQFNNQVSDLINKQNENGTVLFFGAHFCWPPKNGSDRRMSEVLDLYKIAGYSVVIVRIGNMSFSNNLDFQNLSNRFSAVVEDIYLSDKSFQILKDAYSNSRQGNSDEMISKYYNHELFLKFSKIYHKYSPDSLHINYAIYSWLAVPALNSNTLKVLDTHDIVSKRLKLSREIISKSSGWPKQSTDIPLGFLKNHTSKQLGFKFDCQELEALSVFDRLITISQTEFDILKAYLPDSDVYYLPYMPNPSPRQFIPSKGNVAGLGGGANLVNMSAGHLAFDITRKMHNYFDDFHLKVVGNLCNLLSDKPYLSKAGFVDSISDSYLSTSYSLCLIPMATGQNIKVTESITRGCPVITFSDIANDTGVIHGINGIVVNNLEEAFIEVKNLYMDKEMYMSLNRRNFEWLNTTYIENMYERAVMFEKKWNF